MDQSNGPAHQLYSFFFKKKVAAKNVKKLEMSKIQKNDRFSMFTHKISGEKEHFLCPM
jgi:hypothetical protein